MWGFRAALIASLLVALCPARLCAQEPEEQQQFTGGASSEANELFRSAMASYRAKDYQAAATALKRAVELDPAHRWAWNWLCMAEYELHQYGNAAAACRKQIDISPEDKYAYNNLGRALRAQGKLDDAERAFRKQIGINPKDRYAHGNLGLLLRNEKKCDAAIPELETALDIAPKNDAARDALRLCYLDTGQAEKAERLSASGAASANDGKLGGGAVSGGLAAPEGDYFNPDIGIKLHVPEGWKVTAEKKPSFTEPGQAMIVKLGALASLMLTHDHLEATPQTYRTLMEDKMAKAPEFKKTGEEQVTLDGVSGERILFTSRSKEVEMRGWVEFFDSGDEHYRIAALAPAEMFDRYAPMYAAMLQSVRFAWRHPDEKFASTVPTPQRVRVASDVTQGNLINKVQPEYPPEAKRALIEGVVVLHAVIARDGTIKQLTLESGPPELAEAALRAVRQWRYTPYMLNGSPVEVETTITVNFRLP